MRNAAKAKKGVKAYVGVFTINHRQALVTVKMLNRARGGIMAARKRVALWRRDGEIETAIAKAVA